MSRPGPDLVVAAFVVIPLVLAIAFVWASAYAWRRSDAPPGAVKRASTVSAIAGASWMVLTWLAAERGVLSDWDRTPPPFALLVLAIVGLGIAIAASPFGRRIAQFVPLWALVGIQAFRLPLELSMHRLYERGVMPGQMSYSGRNFDILTGATAILVAAALLAGRGGRTLVLLWNVLGLALLVNVVVVAILSTPVFAYFGRDQLNVFVMHPPFVWLPAVMVLAAWAGHLLIFRALMRGGSRPVSHGAVPL